MTQVQGRTDVGGRIIRGVVTLACVAMSLWLAGCGGGGGDSNGEAQAPTTTESTGTTAAGATTKPGAKLKLGETAHVTFKPLNAGRNSKKTYLLDVTVLEIEKGTIGDFENINLDADQMKSTPYYVSVRVSSTGSEVPVKDDDPDIRFDGIDDRGQEQGSVTFIGTFERCEDNDAPTPFASGESYESCLAYLIPGGGSIQQVNWSGSDEYALKPVVWN